MSARYRRVLDHALGVLLQVEFTTRGGQVVDYAVVLLVEGEKGVETVRLYDGAHGQNEMHRHIRDQGKQPGTLFHRGTLGEGMRAAISEAERGYREMIEGWEGQ